VFACVVLALLGSSSVSEAFDFLFTRVGREHDLSLLYESTQASAAVRDGLLLGHGEEQIERLPSGVVHIVQDRVYTQAKHPKTGQLVALPEPWHIHSTLELSPTLRLHSLDTTLEVHRSIDRAMGYAFTDKVKPLFDWQRVRVHASADGKTLVRSTFRFGRDVETTQLDYPEQAIPIEIVGMVLPVAVRQSIDHFDFELLLPDGATHRVRASIVRTRDLTRFAQGYPLPKDQLHFPGELAVVDLWLAAPLKHLFFPHHFYFVYATAEPTKLLAFWGGDPDDHLQAIRQH
jgi:hypothetical protein